MSESLMFSSTLCELWDRNARRSFYAEIQDEDCENGLLQICVVGISPNSKGAYGWYVANGNALAISAQTPIWRRSVSYVVRPEIFK